MWPARALLTVLLVIELASCSKKGPDYFPLEAGHSWRYRIALKILDDEYSQKYLVANLKPAKLDGEKVFVQRSQSGETSYFTRDSAGIRRIGTRASGTLEIQHDSKRHYMLVYPLAGDTSWTLASRLRLIESRTFAREDKLYKRHLPVAMTYRITSLNESIEVPAGRYTNCIQVTGTGLTRVPVDRGTASAEVEVTHTDWYAPSIGLVKSVRREISESVFLQDGEFRLELEWHDS